MLDDQVLSRITGTVIRGGIERISTREILQVLGCSERETKLIAKRMRSSGWSGPWAGGSSTWLELKLEAVVHPRPHCPQ